MDGKRAQFFPLPVMFLVAAVLGVAALVMLIELRAIEYAYARIGIGHRYVLAALLLSLFGSYINIPIRRLSGGHHVAYDSVTVFGVRWVVPVVGDSTTLLAVNVGGAVIPVALSVRVLLMNDIVPQAAVAALIVAAVTYAVARPVRGVGIAVPTFVPPLMAAGAALMIAPGAAPAVAYVAGTIGTLIGADLMNLRRIAALGAPVVSIGGAGTFDGIFVTGILAVLLA